MMRRRLWRSLLCVLPLCLGAACSPERTTIRVLLTTDEAPITLDSLTITSTHDGERSPPQTFATGKSFTLVSGKTESFVLLFDNKSSGAITIDIDGFSFGERVARGENNATLVAKKNVDVTVQMRSADPLAPPDMSSTADALPVDGGGTD